VADKTGPEAAAQGDRPILATVAIRIRIPAHCGMEVKQSGVDFNEAVVRLRMWCAIVLKKMRSMITAGSSKVLKPFLCWTVTGYEWRLHISGNDQFAGDRVPRVFPHHARLTDHVQVSALNKPAGTKFSLTNRGYDKEPRYRTVADYPFAGHG
jgi:hypothetical protein